MPEIPKPTTPEISNDEEVDEEPTGKLIDAKKRFATKRKLAGIPAGKTFTEPIESERQERERRMTNFRLFARWHGIKRTLIAEEVEEIMTGVKQKLLPANSNVISLDQRRPEKLGTDVKKYDRSRFDHATLNFDQILGQDLRNGNFHDTKFINARLIGSDLSNAVLTDCDFRGADLRYANFNGTDLSGADLSTAIIDETTTFKGANLTGTKLPENFPKPKN